MMSKNDLKNKVVLIAGGAKNLGGLLSRDFAAKGAKLAIHYNSDATKADAEKHLQMFRQQEPKHFCSRVTLQKLRILPSYSMRQFQNLVV